MVSFVFAFTDRRIISGTFEIALEILSATALAMAAFSIFRQRADSPDSPTNLPKNTSTKAVLQKDPPRWCLKRRLSMCAIPSRDNDYVLIIFLYVKRNYPVWGKNTRLAALPRVNRPRLSQFWARAA
jgi:hypothetical protein